MLKLTGSDLAIEDVVDVARFGKKVGPIDQEVQARMRQSQAWVESAVNAGEVIYGVTTGFGPLATTSIRPDQARILSRKLVLNCLAGVGDPLNKDVVRAMVLVRANSLVKGTQIRTSMPVRPISSTFCS